VFTDARVGFTIQLRGRSRGLLPLLVQAIRDRVTLHLGIGATKGTEVQTPIWRQRIVVSALVLLLAASSGVSRAGAVSNGRAASLKISAPASMARGSVLTVTASGYAGPYNAVSWSSQKGSAACATPNSDSITTQAVPKGHTFDVKLTNIVGAPGPVTVCVYLFSSGPGANQTKGHYVVKSQRVKVA
jgi:hypothetical protein